MNTTTATYVSPVTRAAKTARAVEKDALQKVFSTAESARTELSQLLPIEGGQRERLSTVAHTNTHRVVILAAMQATGEQYLEFPTESMKWRDEENMPALVPFPLGENQVVFSSYGFGQVYRRESLPNGGFREFYNSRPPECVQSFYADVNQFLAEKLGEKNGETNSHLFRLTLGFGFVCTLVILGILAFISAETLGTTGKVLWGGVGAIVSFGLSYPLALFKSQRRYGKLVEAYHVVAGFDGLIPEYIRQKIRRALSLGIFKEVFILAEVPGLKMEETKIPQPALVGDPLVIGYDGSEFWLIAAFNTSPVEALAQSTTVKVD